MPNPVISVTGPYPHGKAAGPGSTQNWLPSGTRKNQMFGPPEPAASTNALSAVGS